MLRLHDIPLSAQNVLTKVLTLNKVLPKEWYFLECRLIYQADKVDT